jgi:hypothetical protein
MSLGDVVRPAWWRTVTLRRPWSASGVAGLAAGWGVAHSQPCSIKWRGGGCALELPYDSTWTGGILWGLVAAVVARVAPAFLAAWPAAQPRG